MGGGLSIGGGFPLRLVRVSVRTVSYIYSPIQMVYGFGGSH